MTTRALVLGGGGPVGIAWESGLLAGLAEGGVLLADADLIVGTSAGSWVGAELAIGRTPAELFAAQLSNGTEPRPEGPPVAAPSLKPLMLLMQKAQTGEIEPEALRREMGALSLSAQTRSEDEFLLGFGRLKDVKAGGWPERRFICTAVDTADGAFVTWDRDSGVDLARAVASSCSVPGIFPPITINGHRYMDGGMRSSTNADLAKGHERTVLIAVSSGAGDDPRTAMLRRRLEDEMEALREGGGSVELITPNAASLPAFGVNLMDSSRRGPAAEAGLQQGRDEAARLQPFWTQPAGPPRA